MAVVGVRSFQMEVVVGVWVPRGVDPTTREVLVEGVPGYMKQALLDWLRGQLCYYGRATGKWYFHEGKLNGFDLVARPKHPYAPRATGVWPGFIADLPDDDLLDLADWLIHRPGADRSEISTRC